MNTTLSLAFKISTRNQPLTEPSNNSSNVSIEHLSSTSAQPVVLNLTTEHYRSLSFLPHITTSCAHTSHSTTEHPSKFLTFRTSKPFKANGSKFYPCPELKTYIKERLFPKRHKDVSTTQKILCLLHHSHTLIQIHPHHQSINKIFIPPSLSLYILHKTFVRISVQKSRNAFRGHCEKAIKISELITLFIQHILFFSIDCEISFHHSA